MRRYASGLARCVKNRRLPHIAWPRRRSLPSRPVRRRTASIRPRCSAWPATAMHGVPASCQESGRGRHLYVDPDTFTSNESVDQLNARFRRGAVELGKLAVLPTLERVSAMATASRDKPSALPEIFGFRARGFGAPRLHDWHGHRRGSDERLRIASPSDRRQVIAPSAESPQLSCRRAVVRRMHDQPAVSRDRRVT